MRIAHIADCHLRDSQYGRKSRGQDFLNGFRNAVNLAYRREANAIIVAGDLFDSTKPSATIIADLIRIAREDKWDEKGAPIYITRGNHDMTYPGWGSVLQQSCPNVFVDLDKEWIREGGQWRCILDEPYDIGGVKVLGVPFMSPEELRSVFKEYDHLLWKTDVLVWHGEIKEFCGYPKEGIIEVADFPEGLCQVVMMGDQHINKAHKRESDGLIIAYPGSTELCSSAEDPQKVVRFWDFIDGELQDMSYRPFPTRPVQRYTIRTEEDLENCLRLLEPDALTFISFSRDVENVVPRLKRAIGDEGILRLKPLPQEIVVEGKITSDEEILKPVDFMKRHIQEYMGSAAQERMMQLCEAILDPKADYRQALDRYCSEKLKGKLFA